MSARTQPARGRRFAVAAILIGIGLGGLFDGIVLHQILQWHHMVSTPVPPTTVENLEVNTLGDGLFHAVAWIVTLAGVLLLLGTPDGLRGRRQLFFGGMLIGWGAFNTIEGIADHYVLKLHHVRPGPDEALWDAAFVGWGAAMIAAGWLVGRMKRPLRNVSERL